MKPKVYKQNVYKTNLISLGCPTSLDVLIEELKSNVFVEDVFGKYFPRVGSEITKPGELILLDSGFLND